MKKLIIVMAVIATMVSVAGAVQIKSVNANFLNSTFTPDGYGLGILSIIDTADIVVEYPDGSQFTHIGKDFVFNIPLVTDLSTGGIADGLFQDGSLAIGNAGALFSAADVTLQLTELYNNSGILAGTGDLEVTSGSLAADFGTLGEIVQITFSVTPSSIGDFRQGFTGISNITLIPIPEPATICLIGLGSLMLRKKR